MKTQNPQKTLAQAVLQNPHFHRIFSVLLSPSQLGIVFYDVGIQETQVWSQELYQKWITGGLRTDVNKAIFENHADIIALCGLGTIEEGLGPSLARWKTSARAAKPGDYHLVEDMLRALVDDPQILAKHPLGWSIHATNHYGLLISNSTVRLIDAPECVSLLTDNQAYRVTQRCSFAANTNSVEKPFKVTELWNVHCPVSRRHPYGAEVRRQVCSFLQQKSGQRVIWGGNLNQSLLLLDREAQNHLAIGRKLEPWTPLQPSNGRYGDIVCVRGVIVDLMRCLIGKEQLHSGVSDNHVMVGVKLTTEFDSAAESVEATPTSCLLYTSPSPRD